MYALKIAQKLKPELLKKPVSKLFISILFYSSFNISFFYGIVYRIRIKIYVGA